jgi:hypothetical protein
MGTRYRGVPFVEMPDIDIMARFSVPYVNIYGAYFGISSARTPGAQRKMWDMLSLS